MAGTAKPNIDNLLHEVDYKVIAAYNSLGINASNCGLFDNYTMDVWNSPTVMYWNNSTAYVDLVINEPCNIWRCGSAVYPHYSAKLKVMKYEEKAWLDVTSEVVQTVSNKTNLQWEKTISKLPRGRYKFCYLGGLRLDTEWYMEAVNTYLIKFNNNYYTIKQEFYNQDTKSYNPIVDEPISNFNDLSFSITELFSTITIGESSFRPIEKFNHFQLIYNENVNLNLRGIRSNKELIVASDDIITSVSNTIEYFKLLASQTGGGAIKVAISIDKGHTWNTYSNGILTLLPVTIPIKPYSSLSTDETAQWESGKDIIGEQGISVELFNIIDFNLIENFNSLRLAYVLTRPTYGDTAETDSLSWKFDAKGHLKKMKDSEYDTEVYEQQIKFISLIENPLIKVNILV